MSKIFKSITPVLAATMLFAGCSKKIDEAYQNPNADVRVPVETLLPPIISSMAANAAGHGTMPDIRYVGQYIQNWQYYLTLSNFDRMGYTNSAADVAQSTWRMHYYDIGQNNMRMIDWATEEKKWDYVGVGQAIFAWSWMVLTDYYGDVILKEAFNTDLLTFKYDSQEEVYEHVRSLCMQALENLNKTGEGVSKQNLAAGDAYFYQGDVEKWKKFVNGLMARYHLRMSNKQSFNADSVIYYADRAITTNDDNAMVKFAATNISGTNNFFGPFRNNLAGATAANPTAVRQSNYIVNLMTGNNTAFQGVGDPRAIYMLRLNNAGTFKGLNPNKGQNELSENERPENFWGVSQATASNTAPANDDNIRYIFRNSAPFPIMTAAEMKFVKAEAAFRKGDKNLALQAYTEGISLNMDMLTGTFETNVPEDRKITPESKNAYLTSPVIVPTQAADLTLNKIMLQKYIALFGHGVLETWVDMRRYHYTDIDASSGVQVYTDFTPPSGVDLFPDNNGKLVYKMRPRYNSEYVWNINELKRLGADQPEFHTTETWFAKP